MSTPTGMGRAAQMGVDVSVHVYPETPLAVRLHPAEDRVVVHVGDGVGGCPQLVLFLQRGELVALRDVLAAAVTDLDTARRELAATLLGDAGSADAVRDSAA